MNVSAGSLSADDIRLRDIADSLGEGVYVADGRGRIVFLNPEGERLLGWNEAELTGRDDAHDLMHNRKPDGSRLPLGECRISGVVATGVRYASRDEVFVRKDGAVFPVEVVATPLWKDGKVAASVVAFQDISVSKRQEQEREALIAELHKVLAEIKTLHGIIPICSWCKKIRDDKGAWRQLEMYISEHTESRFSHGLCEECLRTHYPRPS